jgi:hypothetical protein
MPEFCPIGVRGCDGCRHYWEDRCFWHFPSVPVSELMSCGEELEALQRRVLALEKAATLTAQRPTAKRNGDNVTTPKPKTKIAGGVPL